MKFSPLRTPCERQKNQLSDYIDDTLSERQKAVVAAHLRACPLCQNELAALKKTRELVGRFYVTPTAPDAYYARFAARLQERIEQRGRWFPQRIRAAVARFGWQLQTHLLRCLPVGKNSHVSHVVDTPRVVVLSVLLLAMSALGVVTFRHVLDVPQENVQIQMIQTPRGTLALQPERVQVPIGEKRYVGGTSGPDVESVGTHAVRPPEYPDMSNAPAPFVTPKPLGSRQLSATPVPYVGGTSGPDNSHRVVNSLSGTPTEWPIVETLPTRGMLLTDTDYALLLVQGIAGTHEGHQPYEPKRHCWTSPPTGFAPLLLDVPLETRTIREVYDSIKL